MRAKKGEGVAGQLARVSLAQILAKKAAVTVVPTASQLFS